MRRLLRGNQSRIALLLMSGVLAGCFYSPVGQNQASSLGANSPLYALPDSSGQVVLQYQPPAGTNSVTYGYAPQPGAVLVTQTSKDATTNFRINVDVSQLTPDTFYPVSVFLDDNAESQDVQMGFIVPKGFVAPQAPAPTPSATST